MKIVCDRAALVDALALTRGVVAARSPSPVLTCLKLSAGEEGLSISATDGEAGISLSLGSVEVREAGETLVPADRLEPVIRSLDDDTVSLETEKSMLHVRGEHSHFKIFGYEVREFPGVPQLPEDAEGFSIGAAAFRSMIGRTLFATAVENSRYAISGVLLERRAKKLRMVATDGRRLAMTRGECGGDGGDLDAIVPGKTLTVLSRLLVDPEAAVRVSRQGSRIWFLVGEGQDAACLSSSLVEGVFPPFEDVIPKDQDKRVSFDIAEFAGAVRRAALLTNEESRGVRMAFTPGRLTLSSRAPEAGEAEIELDIESYEGEPLEIGFNPAQLTDALKVLDGPEVVFELKSPNKPGVLKSGNDFTYVVMPMTLS
ncbi:MAG: DNA polymerase III subunit beta [Planctomycetota bacterium]|jgi:DNA polymerase-3 subunit beta